MCNLAFEFSKDLFGCFGVRGTTEVYTQGIPNWIEVTPYSVVAYLDGIIIYEYERDSAKGIDYFQYCSVNESRLAQISWVISNCFYDMRGNEVQEFVEDLQENKIIWTT